MCAQDLDELCINTLRFLAVDAVQKANSGHPGAPLGAATMAYALWDRFLKHNPKDPEWPDRDRFILSAGHASAMLYSLLHLTGYNLPLEQLKQFRQWGSRTPGHPEYGLVPGVEVTTGPLGQGFANGVGMAIAERFLASRYNQPGHQIIGHRIYAICSDGDLMEGVASEAASLAGHLGLSNIIYLYDSNGVSLAGPTSVTFTEDVGRRFEAYGWRVIGPIDGLDLPAVEGALRQAQSGADRPALIICKTIIGYGSPHKAGTYQAHGEPLGPEEVKLTKEKLGWPYPEPFTIPPEALAHYRLAIERGGKRQQEWRQGLEAYRKAFPEKAGQLESDLRGDLPARWDDGLAGLFKPGDKPMPTREASGRVLNALAAKIPSLAGGSGDLDPSTRTFLKDQGDFALGNYSGRNIHFGVREHSMGAIASGMGRHGGMIPFTATFLIFSDYMRPPMRLAALMGIRVVYVFTHDSVALGEDGPTHQPVEHLMGLRAIPNMVLIRPADATETAEAWRLALERRNGPTALVLTRQALPVLDRTRLAPASGVRQGGYVLWEAGTRPDIVLIATGSEVHIALDAGRMLLTKNVVARIVSMPSWALFDSQHTPYRDSVLLPSVKARISIEAGATQGWERYIGRRGVAIGVDHFGASAPGPVIYQHLGLTPERVVDQALRLLNGGGRA